MAAALLVGGGAGRREGAPRSVAPRSLLPADAAGAGGGDLYGRKAGSASSSSSSGKMEVVGPGLGPERGGRLMILLSTGLEDEEDEDDSDLAGLLGSGEWDPCGGGGLVVERCRVEGRCCGPRGDLGPACGLEEDSSWGAAEAMFCVATVVVLEGVAVREMTGGRRTARDDFMGVPAPGVPMLVRGRGESLRMEVGEEGRLPVPEAARFIDSPLAVVSCAVIPDGKPALTGEAAPLAPVATAALRKRPMSWLVCRSARVWAIISRKSTPTPKDMALYDRELSKCICGCGCDLHVSQFIPWIESVRPGDLIMAECDLQSIFLSVRSTSEMMFHNASDLESFQST